MYVADISVLVTGDRGPCSKYDITVEKDHFKGELEFTWSGDPLKVGIYAFMYNCIRLLKLYGYLIYTYVGILTLLSAQILSVFKLVHT